MNCGNSFVKYLLFIFNFLFTLCGLAILIVGVIIHLRVKNVADILENNITFPSIALIVVGAVIFTVAFFGCCGAIRESHCMIVTFAMLLLTILVIQVAIAIFAFVKLKGMDNNIIREPYAKTFNHYYDSKDSQEFIDWAQSSLECCGVDSYNDWKSRGNSSIPWSCCSHEKPNDKSECTVHYVKGCVEKITVLMKNAGEILGYLAAGIAVVEFIGIIFALCLANSIRNSERRGYRV